MLQNEDLTSRDIERIADLRQPEVNIALTELLKRKWVDVIRYIMENKVRPEKIYHLFRSLDDILEGLKEEIVGDYTRKMADIEKVREMVIENNEVIIKRFNYYLESFSLL